jgi:predicted ATPase with chaperone activity
MDEGRFESSATQTEHKPIWPPLPRKSDEDVLGQPEEHSENGVTVDMPRAPETVQDIGLSPSFLVELVLKVIHYAETPTAEHVARVVGLPTRHVIELLDALKSDRLCEIIGGSTYDLSSTYRFRLTETGKKRAEEALERCRYAGAAPVTVGQYERVITGLGPTPRPSSESIRESLSSLILDPTAATYLERAFHSCRSTMVFGPSGNGKTHVITEFIKHLGGEVLVPYAIYAYGQIIRIYDPLNHVQVRDAETLREDVGQGFKRTASRDDLVDRRWVRIKRPGLIVGGELTAESLELGYDPLTHFYQAPKHLKAQGGFLVVDDFGRQKVSPTELLNRWIMAMERGRDNLLLRTGESIDVPFKITLLLSTNLNPADLADAAFLRRIPYKAYIPATTAEQFSEILRKVSAEYGANYTEANLKAAVAAVDKAATTGLSGSLARDLVSIIVDNAELERISPEITAETMIAAYKQFSGFAQQADALASAPGKKSTPGTTAARVT